MSNYRRSFTPGGCFFFTVVTYKRQKLFSDNENISLLRDAFRKVKNKYPFTVDAIVVLPDHIHTIWQLPPDDANYSIRWRLIKHFVSSHIKTPATRRKEKQVWQRRFWEHTIQNEKDWRNHMDYIHYNPVNHGYTGHPHHWNYSSFKRAVNKGWYDKNWGDSLPDNIRKMNLE